MRLRGWEKAVPTDNCHGSPARGAGAFQLQAQTNPQPTEQIPVLPHPPALLIAYTHLFPDYTDDIHRGEKASSSSCFVYYQAAQQQHSYTDAYNGEPAWHLPALSLLRKTTATRKSQMPAQPSQPHAHRCCARKQPLPRSSFPGGRTVPPPHLQGSVEKGDWDPTGTSDEALNTTLDPMKMMMLISGCQTILKSSLRLSWGLCSLHTHPALSC